MSEKDCTELISEQLLDILGIIFRGFERSLECTFSNGSSFGESLTDQLSLCNGATAQWLGSPFREVQQVVGTRKVIKCATIAQGSRKFHNLYEPY